MDDLNRSFKILVPECSIYSRLFSSFFVFDLWKFILYWLQDQKSLSQTVDKKYLQQDFSSCIDYRTSNVYISIRPSCFSRNSSIQPITDLKSYETDEQTRSFNLECLPSVNVSIYPPGVRVFSYLEKNEPFISEFYFHRFVYLFIYLFVFSSVGNFLRDIDLFGELFSFRQWQTIGNSSYLIQQFQ